MKHWDMKTNTPRSPEARRLIDRIRQRQSLFRLSFGKAGVTRQVLYAQALAFEEWLSQLAEDER